MTEVLLRNSTLTDVDIKLRQIDLIAVPWDQEARVFWRDDWWTEVFKRGSFEGIEGRAGEVRVNREHIKGKTVGKIEAFDPNHAEGLWARVKVVKGPTGDEVLNLAEDDMISASVGYKASKPTDVQIDKPARRRTVVNAWLDHLGLVEDPAYDGAKVLTVREDSSGLMVADGPLPDTPLLDEFMNDPAFRWASERISF